MNLRILHHVLAAFCSALTLILTNFAHNIVWIATKAGSVLADIFLLLALCAMPTEIFSPHGAFGFRTDRRSVVISVVLIAAMLLLVRSSAAYNGMFLYRLPISVSYFSLCFRCCSYPG